MTRYWSGRSRGHLWQLLRPSAAGRHNAEGHPLFLLAASARVGADVDERDLVGGLFGAPLEVVVRPGTASGCR
ncbi:MULTISPECIES: UbiD family decarboxylase [Streptomyces]|uniref:UbiD family decarboxylase n=1 Tax=Streptomyces TaxID=1883 RepID=UPI001CECC7BA|nr:MULTISPECIES: UbiD family decarboxylase [Streptomyces]MDI6410370.1 UbiD family decarboxylase [Streptomyces albus]